MLVQAPAKSNDGQPGRSLGSLLREPIAPAAHPTAAHPLLAPDSPHYALCKKGTYVLDYGFTRLAVFRATRGSGVTYNRLKVSGGGELQA